MLPAQIMVERIEPDFVNFGVSENAGNNRFYRRLANPVKSLVDDNTTELDDFIRGTKPAQNNVSGTLSSAHNQQIQTVGTGIISYVSSPVIAAYKALFARRSFKLKQPVKITFCQRFKRNVCQQ